MHRFRISLGEKKGGGVQVNFVNPLGNGAKAGLKGRVAYETGMS